MVISWVPWCIGLALEHSCKALGPSPWAVSITKPDVCRPGSRGPDGHASHQVPGQVDCSETAGLGVGACVSAHTCMHNPGAKYIQGSFRIFSGADTSVFCHGSDQVCPAMSLCCQNCSVTMAGAGYSAITKSFENLHLD